MAIESVLHMNGGNGESSYANNSSFQKSVVLKTKPVIEDSIKDLYINGGLPECLKIADLGCSSGPNTLFLVSEIIDIFHGLCKQHSHKVPEFQVFLNDLPENDFNSIFKSLSFYFDKLKKEKGDLFGPTFILAMPGSFYQRLFPSKSLHFVHSSYSVHWLSQVPEGLENNKRNIYMSKTSPPNVLEAYSKQFQRDFFTFIHLRSEEIIAGGCMVLTFIGRSLEDPTCEDCCCPWDLLTKSLLDLEAEGLVKEADIDSFNMPYYTPYKDEVESIIQKEGSFSINRLEVFEETLVDVMNHNENDREYMSEKNTIIAILQQKE